MSNHQFKIANSKSRIPTVLPLPDAASKYGLSEQALTQLIEAGKIEAVQLPSGEILVTAENDRANTKDEIISERFAHLKGKLIRLSDAARKYEISTTNLARWAKSGYIEVLKRESYNTELNEADVAYCAYIYKLKKEACGGRAAGVNIFDRKGNPYHVKYPDLSAKRRK